MPGIRFEDAYMHLVDRFDGLDCFEITADLAAAERQLRTWSEAHRFNLARALTQLRRYHALLDFSPSREAALAAAVELLVAQCLSAAEGLERDARSYPDGNFPSVRRFVNQAAQLRAAVTKVRSPSVVAPAAIKPRRSLSAAAWALAHEDGLDAAVAAVKALIVDLQSQAAGAACEGAGS